MASLRSHWAAGLDPVILARQVEVEPDPWQAAVLRSRSRRLHLNCARQIGKSTTASLIALHTALYTPGSLTLVVSKAEDQANELFKKIKAFYYQVGRPVEASQENVSTLVLENGSRILSKAATAGGIRGYSVHLLLVDEGAYVDDEVWKAVNPSVSMTRGRIVAMSTPNGPQGWWYDVSPTGTLGAQWEHVVVPVTECPRHTPDSIADLRDSMSDREFRQEYLCEFIDAAGTSFTKEDIDSIWAEETTAA